MKKLFSILALCAFALHAERTVLILQFPPDQKVDLTLYRTAANDKIDNSPKKFHCRDLSHSSQPPSSTNTFCIGGCA